MPSRPPTDVQVARILRAAAPARPILVGGQAIAAWRQVSSGDQGGHDLASKDIDFFRNPEAVRLLVDAFGGTSRTPGFDDHGPIAHVVSIPVDGTTLEIDFIGHVLGADPKKMPKRAIGIPYDPADSGETIVLALIHPIDALWSRLANINTLGRDDPLSIRQCAAAIDVLEAFLFYLLDDGQGAHRMRTKILRELCHGLAKAHVGRPAQIIHCLSPERIIPRALERADLDPRWRRLTLQRLWASLQRRLRKAKERDGNERERGSKHLVRAPYAFPSDL